MMHLSKFEHQVSVLEAELDHIRVHSKELRIRSKANVVYYTLADLLEEVAEDLDRLAGLEK